MATTFRKQRRVALGSCSVIACAAALAVCSTSNAYTIARNFSIPAAAAIAASPDGSIWVVSNQCFGGGCSTTVHALYHVTPDGQVVSKVISGIDRYYGELGRIAVGPDGNVWVTVSDAPRFGRGELLRVKPNGTIKVFQLPGELNDSAMFVAPGPDGSVWFTGVGSSVGKLLPSGRVKYFRVSDAITLTGLEQGADGAMWLSRSDYEGYFDPGLVKALRITSTGGIRHFKTLPAISMTLGPDGNMWLPSPKAIQRLTPRGRLKRFPIGCPHLPQGDVVCSTDRWAYNAVAGPDRTLAFETEQGGGDAWAPGYSSFGTMTMSGKADETFQQPGIGALQQPIDMVSAPDGELWTTNDANGLTALAPDLPTLRKPGHPSIRRLKWSGRALIADLRCSGSPGVFCSGVISVRANGHQIRRRRYAIAPFNRLELRIPVAQAEQRTNATLTMSSVDPISKVVTTSKRSARVG